MESLKEKVAVITGGASGLGLAMAKRFAADGASLVLQDIEPTALEKAVADFKAEGVKAIGVGGDVSKEETLENLLKVTLETYGKANILCNNAGVGSGGLSWELSHKDWEWVIGVDLWSIIHGIRHFVPQMLEQGDECHVVNTASLAGLTSAPMMGPYNVCKHAVVTLSETMYQEMQLLDTKIGVSVLCPAWVNTKIDESDRNRPADMQNAEQKEETQAEQLLQMQIKQFLRDGLDPSVIGEAVYDAVKNNKFYILTHPEFESAIQTRMEDILQKRNPSPGATELTQGVAAPVAK